MGYRSDVGYVMAFPTEAIRDEFVAVHRIMKSREVIVELDQLEETGGGRTLTFSADGVKWYEDYDDTKIHEAFMKACVDNFDGAYCFARTGDELDDVEETGEGPEELQELCRVFICRSVVINDLDLSQ
jgi:hypothetical protein